MDEQSVDDQILTAAETAVAKHMVAAVKDANELERLIAVLKAAGVKHFKQGDLEIVFDRGIELPRPRSRAIPDGAVLADPVI